MNRARKQPALPVRAQAAPGYVPELCIRNRQRALRIDLPHLRTFAARALPACLEQAAGEGSAPLPRLETVEISFVSDRVIADLHVRFMGVPGPTDVITFAHGEIVVSAVTAARQAREFGQDFHRELARYIVHGLLHLNGHEDAAEPAAAAMWRVQEDIIAGFWPPGQAADAPAVPTRKAQTCVRPLNPPPGTC